MNLMFPSPGSLNNRSVRTLQPERKQSMNVGQVITLVQEWIELHGSLTSGFCGAHLVGGILSMPKESFFPPYLDVDFKLVLHSTQEVEPHDIAYKGLILEYGTIGIEHYRSAEAVLSNPEHASNLAVDSILSDPAGLLLPLQGAVHFLQGRATVMTKSEMLLSMRCIETSH